MIFALDPLFRGDAGTLEVVLIVILKVLVAFGVLLLTVMLYIWWMRKFISDMQNRVGPSRAGPFGILQTLADGIKLFFKEDLIPNKADKFVFKLAPFFSIVPLFSSSLSSLLQEISVVAEMEPLLGSAIELLSNSPTHI